MSTTKIKKIAVIDLGDVRDESWEHAAELGLDLIREMREKGFEPQALSPYVSDGGDVPLLILVKMEESQDELKKKIELLESIVSGKKDSSMVGVNIIDDESGYWWLDDYDSSGEDDEEEDDEDL